MTKDDWCRKGIFSTQSNSISLLPCVSTVLPAHRTHLHITHLPGALRTKKHQGGQRSMKNNDPQKVSIPLVLFLSEQEKNSERDNGLFPQLDLLNSCMLFCLLLKKINRGEAAKRGNIDTCVSRGGSQNTSLVVQYILEEKRAAYRFKHVQDFLL